MINVPLFKHNKTTKGSWIRFHLAKDRLVVVHVEDSSSIFIPFEPMHGKTQFGVPTRSDTNRAVQSQTMVRGWKF